MLFCALLYAIYKLSTKNYFILIYSIHIKNNRIQKLNIRTNTYNFYLCMTNLFY